MGLFLLVLTSWARTLMALWICLSMPDSSSPGMVQMMFSGFGVAPFNSRSSPVVLRNQPRNGMRRVPSFRMFLEPVDMTPPAVGTPTSLPRLRVWMAWAKISAFENEFWLQRTTMGLSQVA